MTTYQSGSSLSAINKATIPSQLARMDFLRRRDYRENLRFYYGFQWPQQTINQRRRRLVFNYAKTIVEKVTSYLMTGRSFAVEPDGDSAEAVAKAKATERLLERVHWDQDLEMLDFDNEIDCAILGDAVYKVTWDQDRQTVRVTHPDVTGLYVWWQPDDLTRVWRVASQYALDNEQISDLYGLVLDEKQPSQKVTEVWTARSFQLFIGARIIDERPNPYGLIPFVIYPNLRKPHQFWGESDITNIKMSVIELNRAFSQLSAILEVSGNPIAVLEGVTEARDIAVEPGAVWEIPSEAKAYLLDLLAHGGMDIHLKYIDVLYRTLHDLGESPRTAFGGSASPNIAALAMQLDLDPIIKKVRRKQLIRAVAYRRRAELILRLYDQYTGGWRVERAGEIAQKPGAPPARDQHDQSGQLRPYWPCRVRVNWAPVMPQDRARDAEVDALLVDRGVIARQTAARLAGVEDTTGELQQWLEENQRIQAAGGYPGKPEPARQENPISPA